MRRILGLTASHVAALGIGFALGVYLLPILTAPASPDAAVLAREAAGALYQGEFRRDLKGSDLLHWGEGTISLTDRQIVHDGKLSPGPDYKLYLTRSFVTHEDEFLPIKSEAALVGDIKSFNGVIVDVPDGIEVTSFSTVVIWCESFGEFITAAQYR